MTISPELRQLVTERANHRCEYCRTTSRLTGMALEIDHILPLSRGGDSSAANLCLACRRCNAYKGYLTHLSNLPGDEPIPLFNPRLDTWSAHFAWSETGDHLLGQTPTGQATIKVLRMNDPLIVRARSLWVSAGWHPPKE